MENEYIFSEDVIIKDTRNVINILINTEKRYIPKAEYVFRTFCSILGLKPSFFYNYAYEEIHVYYGQDFKNDYPVNIYHNPKAVDFFDQIKLYPNEDINQVLYQDIYIPFLFSLPGKIFEISNKKVIIKKDIITSAFYFLTCWQEYVDEQNLIPGDRYDYRQSLQNYLDLTEIPVVDYYCQIFEVTLKIILKKFANKKKWPNNASFCLTLSHDIDYYNFWNKKHLNMVYKHNLKKMKKNFISALYKIVGHFITKQCLWNPEKALSSILNYEQKLKVNSTSFLMSQSEILDERQAYFNDEQQLKQIIKIFQKHSVGLHGTKAASVDEDLLTEQLILINSYDFAVKGYRNHFLSFNYQKSFKILEQAGFVYDATLGFWENIGYRAGISLPFYPFNIKENRPFSVLEIPLTIMDVTLFTEKAMNLSYNSAKHKIKKIVNNTHINNTHLSILWHNNTFDCIDYPYWQKLYWEIIRYSKRKNAWICSLDDLANYWITE
ncbi:MAG: hypothetical protein M0Q94_07145 [Candidatus Cloacimonetes bacterium]|jgi:hypothetical protein|nr:hypothetical protein [Candidatus Cloacimonadota bacterium]